MKVVVLCAGYATRLYPLTLNAPKPLLPVKGKPVLEHILGSVRSLASSGVVDKVFIVSNNKFFSHFVSWRDAFSFPVPVVVLNDGTLSNDDRLGAVGDLLFVLEKEAVDDDVLLLAGDNLFETDFSSLFSFSEGVDSSVIGVFDLGDKSLLANKFGVVLVDSSSRIVDFEEKPSLPKSSLAATAVYLLKRDDVSLLRSLSGSFFDNMGDLVSFLVKNSRVFAWPLSSWVDIGSKEDYERVK